MFVDFDNFFSDFDECSREWQNPLQFTNVWLISGKSELSEHEIQNRHRVIHIPNGFSVNEAPALRRTVEEVASLAALHDNIIPRGPACPRLRITNLLLFCLGALYESVTCPERKEIQRVASCGSARTLIHRFQESPLGPV